MRAAPLFDPLSPDFVDDPYTTYANLRTRDPVHWYAPLRAWVLSRYRDCRYVLGNPGRFASDTSRARPGEPAPPGVQGLDPPEGRELRAVIADALRMAEDADAETVLADRAARALATAGPGPFDALEHLVRPLVLAAAGRLGATGLDQRTFFPHVAAAERLMDAGLRPELAEEAAPSRAYLGGLVAGWCASPPPGSPIAHLKRRFTELGATREDLEHSVRFLVLSTCGSTGAAVGNALSVLLRHPSGLAALEPLDRPGRDRAAAELLRFAGPVQAVVRACTEDVTLGGRRLARGDDVILLIGAANRDPEAFERPDELRLHRDPNPHLALGRGPHVCLGTSSAYTMFRAAFTALLGTRPRLTAAGEPGRTGGATFRSLTRLPVTAA